MTFYAQSTAKGHIRVKHYVFLPSPLRRNLEKLKLKWNIIIDKRSGTVEIRRKEELKTEELVS